MSGLEWEDAADLALWCLQSKPERRPQSFEQILSHRFFDDSGQLHLLNSDGDTLEEAAKRCTKDMHAAIQAGDLAELKAAFDGGAVHALAALQRSSAKLLPFHHAAERGNLDVIRYLMSEMPALVAVQQVDNFGTDDEKLSGLVKDALDRQDQFGYTALHWCAAYNRADVARELLNHGCDPSICNHSGKTAWDVAESAKSTEVLDLFEEKVNPNRLRKRLLVKTTSISAFQGKTTRDASTFTAEKEQSGSDPDQGVDESDKTVGRIEESLLRLEWERRKRRPDVPSTSDDIELDHARLTYWNVEPYDNWAQIGEGGNGRVFLVTEVAPAIQIVINTKVRQFHQAVVKFAKPDGVEALKAEVESLSVLEHKNVVEILGMAEGGAPEMEGSHWMMLLEYCESDLEKLLHVNRDPTHKEYSWELMGRLCREIVDGMAYLHSKEHGATGQTYMHLDLKPDNILLANEGTKEQPVWTAKIADFGWVPELTQDEWTGTALYMAPEFAIRNLELDRLMDLPLPTDNVGPAADVFSFGVLLWEMFARQTPFEALTNTPPTCRCSTWHSWTVDGWEFVDRVPCPCQDTSKGGEAYCLRIMTKWMVREQNLRPAFPANFPVPLQLLVEACWTDKPASRP
eukprot:COSAG01_NODE_11289_length_1965_cov_2.263666_1_plen_628_part_10